jgi:hypothetical protein
MVAVILAVLGAGVEKGRTAPIPRAEQGPQRRAPRRPPGEPGSLLEKLQQAGGPWPRSQDFTQFQLTAPKADAVAAKKRAWEAALPATVRRLVEADLVALVAGKTAPALAPSEAVRALDEAERLGAFDHWLCAYLWRRTAGGVDRAEAGALVELYARLTRHARLTNAMIRIRVSSLSFDRARKPGGASAGRAEPFPFPWVAAGGRGRMISSRKVRQCHVPGGLLGTVDSRRCTGSTPRRTPAPARDGVVRLTVAEGSAPGLVRGGNRWMPRPGQACAWSGSTDRHARRRRWCWSTSGWDGSSCPRTGSCRYGPARAAAGRGEGEGGGVGALRPTNNHDGEVRQLERALPLVHAALRVGLKTDGHKPGAARLRLILSLFDDAVTPAAALRLCSASRS